MRRIKRDYENELTFLEVAYSTGYHRGYINEAESWMNDDEYILIKRSKSKSE